MPQALGGSALAVFWRSRPGEDSTSRLPRNRTLAPIERSEVEVIRARRAQVPSGFPGARISTCNQNLRESGLDCRGCCRMCQPDESLCMCSRPERRPGEVPVELRALETLTGGAAGAGAHSCPSAAWLPTCQQGAVTCAAELPGTLQLTATLRTHHATGTRG